MTQLKKRALSSLAIFLPVTLLFLFLFFGDGGAATFAQDRERKLEIAGLFGLGYASFFLMLLLTRAHPGSPRVTTDERDDAIARRANGATLVCVLVFVYVFGLGLWTAYEDEGSLPVGWAHFLAYGTAFFGLLVHAGAVLLLDARERLDG